MKKATDKRSITEIWVWAEGTHQIIYDSVTRPVATEYETGELTFAMRYGSKIQYIANPKYVTTQWERNWTEIL